MLYETVWLIGVSQSNVIIFPYGAMIGHATPLSLPSLALHLLVLLRRLILQALFAGLAGPPLYP